MWRKFTAVERTGIVIYRTAVTATGCSSIYTAVIVLTTSLKARPKSWRWTRLPLPSIRTRDPNPLGASSWSQVIPKYNPYPRSKKFTSRRRTPTHAYGRSVLHSACAREPMLALAGHGPCPCPGPAGCLLAALLPALLYFYTGYISTTVACVLRSLSGVTVRLCFFGLSRQFGA